MTVDDGKEGDQPPVANCLHRGFALVVKGRVSSLLTSSLIRIHFIIEIIWWAGLAPWEFEFPFQVVFNLPSYGGGKLLQGKKLAQRKNIL